MRHGSLIVLIDATWYTWPQHRDLCRCVRDEVSTDEPSVMTLKFSAASSLLSGFLSGWYFNTVIL